MKIGFLLWTVLLTSTSYLAAQVCGADTFTNCQSLRDHEALQNFVNSKRTIPLFSKLGKELKITGDIKGEIAYRDEWLDGIDLIPFPTPNDTSGLPASHTTFESEVNLYINYLAEDKKSWAKVRLNFDNTWGIPGSHKDCTADPGGLFGSGVFGAIDMKHAWVGWNAFEYEGPGCQGKHIFNIEAGRRRLYKAFDSRIEFAANSDGILFDYKNIRKPDWLLFAKLMVFVVDTRSNHYAWVTEMGTEDFFETKFDIKFSYIDWESLLKTNRCGNPYPLGAKYKVAQWMMAYNMKGNENFRDSRLYGAFLINLAAGDLIDVGHPVKAVNFGPQNIGWYLGYIYGGEVRKKGEWSVDFNIQLVEAQAIPNADVFGIGKGRLFPKGNPSFPAGLGKTNYAGWHLEGLYKLTDKLYIDVTFDRSWTLHPGLFGPFDFDKKRFGGERLNNKFEFDAIMEF